jgi:damage-control phosphatase, subfamily I
VIAKGMGNYETISEYDGERPVAYIMKAKCSSVAKALGRNVGDYIMLNR